MMTQLENAFAAITLAGTLVAAPLPAVAAGFSAYAAYEPEHTIKGIIRTEGSDTMGKLMEALLDRFGTYHEDVYPVVKSYGSSTGPKALASLQAQFAPMSRPMSPQEMQWVRDATGFDLKHQVIALDGIAVVVHPDNNVPQLSLKQVDAIFSMQQTCGGSGQIFEWMQVEGATAGGLIDPYSRDQLSGTFKQFQKLALCGGDYHPLVKMQGNSDILATTIAAKTGAVGYVGTAWLDDRVRPVPIARVPGGPAFQPDFSTIQSRDYPLVRELHLYYIQPFDREPPLITEFVRFVMSAEGQKIAADQGLVPVSAEAAQQWVSSLTRN